MSGLYRLATIELVCEGFMPAFQMAFWYIMHRDLEEVVWLVSQFLKGRVHGFFHRSFLSEVRITDRKEEFLHMVPVLEKPKHRTCISTDLGGWVARSRSSSPVICAVMVKWWCSAEKNQWEWDRWQSKTRRMASRTTNCAQSIIIRIFDNVYLRCLGIYSTKHHGR